MSEEIINSLSVGDRIRWRDGHIFVIDRIPTGVQTQVRLKRVDGNRTEHRSPAMLARMIQVKEVSLVNKPLSEVGVQLRLTDASEQELFYFHFRREVARELNTFAKYAPKRHQMEAVASVHAQYCRKAAKRGFLPPDMPTYETGKSWQAKHEEHTNDTKLLVINHRTQYRKPRMNARKREIMHETIRDIQNSRACATIRAGYLELRLRFQEEWPHLTEDQVELKMPSESSYRREVKKYDPDQTQRARSNSTQSRKNSSHGGKIQYPDLIGGMMQVDSTKLDVHIKVEGVSVGVRPWLTVVIDVFTRVIVGWHLSLSAPSANSVKNAILMASTDHAYYRRAKPITLYHDNGREHKNKIITHLSSDIGFDMQAGSPYYPNNQGHIEANFGSMNRRLIHLMGGTTFGKLAQNRPYASEKHPVYDLATCRARIEEYIDIYHDLPHSGLNGMAPHQKWDMAVAEDPLRLPETITEEFAESLRLIAVDCTIYKDNVVQHQKLQWKSPNLIGLKNELEDRGRQAKLYIDPSDLSTAYVAHPSRTRKKIPVDATNPTYQTGLSLENHLRIQAMFDDWNELYQDKAATKTMLGIFYRKLREDAAEMMAKVDGKSRKKEPDFTDSELYLSAVQSPAEAFKEAPKSRQRTRSNSSPFETR